MPKQLVTVTDELLKALQHLGCGSVEHYVYESLGLSIEQKKHDPIVFHKDVPIFVFKGLSEEYWFGYAPGHTTFAAVALDYDSCLQNMQGKIDKVLSVRKLSRLEQQQCNAINRSVYGLYELSGREAVEQLGTTLCAILEQGRDKHMHASCYFLATRVAIADSNVSDKTKAWAEKNYLKFSIVCDAIEQMVAARSAS